MHRGIAQIIQPLFEPEFDDDSFGFRPGRDRRHALARAEQLTTSKGLQYWVVDDIRDAFCQVPRQRLFGVLRRKLPVMSWL